MYAYVLKYVEDWFGYYSPSQSINQPNSYIYNTWDEQRRMMKASSWDAMLSELFPLWFLLVSLYPFLYIAVIANSPVAKHFLQLDWRSFVNLITKKESSSLKMQEYILSKLLL